jgi:hypothetical protein
MNARSKLATWFWSGVGGWVLGAGIALTGLMLDYNEDRIAGGIVLAMAGWSAMLVGIVGKGVELGVRAANED